MRYNKKEVLEIIKEDIGCTDEEAEGIFQRAIKSGKVKWHCRTKTRVNWSVINSRAMYLSVVVLLIWLISIYL